jgi:hypothetical protein
MDITALPTVARDSAQAPIVQERDRSHSNWCRCFRAASNSVQIILSDGHPCTSPIAAPSRTPRSPQQGGPWRRELLIKSSAAFPHHSTLPPHPSSAASVRFQYFWFQTLLMKINRRASKHSHSRPRATLASMHAHFLAQPRRTCLSIIL